MTKDKLIILTGPTAVGKTALSIELAKRLDGEIISADSIQVYKGMDIGSAKITDDEKCGIPHYLIDEFEPEEDFNVFTFQQLAKKYISDIISRGKTPIIVGGTGFYIQSVLYDIDFKDNDDTASKEIRDKLYAELEEKGPEALYARLRSIDPDSCNTIHMNNTKKVVRAIEYFMQTGEKMSVHNTIERSKESPYDFRYFVLNDEREALYDRINRRIDIMMKQGLVDEVKALKAKGLTRGNVSMMGLGYKEILDYLDGNLTLSEAVTEIKSSTRHFAKRQLTWFKREKDVIWVNKNEFENEEEILRFILRSI